MRLLISLLFLCSTIACASEKPSRSLLIGGGFKICSSYSTKYCSEIKSFQGDAFIGNRYQITGEKITVLKEDSFKTFKSKTRKSELVELLKKYLIRNKSEVLTRRNLLRKLDDLSLSSNSKSGRDVVDALSPYEKNFFMQTMQLPVLTSDGKPLTEYVVLEQSHPDSVAIVSRFIEMAKEVSGKEKPLILFSTSSANDVFDAVSFYYQLFKSKEVNVAWLPIEASLNKVVLDDSISCSALPAVRAKNYGVFAREEVYPQLAKYQMKFCQSPALINQLVSEADGIFFNGGDQSLTLASLASVKGEKKNFSSTYELISRRHSEGELVVAGTSAGAAVQSGGILQGKKIPMVTNGESEYGFVNGSVATIRPPSSQCVFENSCDKNVELKTLTRFDSGGFEMMQIGIFDTHFSERDRLFRLIRLMEDSGIILGTGVDENTALEMSNLGGEVVLRGHGEGATWIVQNHSQSSNKFKLHMLWKDESASVKTDSNGPTGELRLIDKGIERTQKLIKRLSTRDDKVSQLLGRAFKNGNKNSTESIDIQSRRVSFEIKKNQQEMISIELNVR